MSQLNFIELFHAAEKGYALRSELKDVREYAGGLL